MGGLIFSCMILPFHDGIAINELFITTKLQLQSALLFFTKYQDICVQATVIGNKLIQSGN